MKSKFIYRRHLLQNLAKAAGLAVLSPMGRSHYAYGKGEPEPHFFIHLFCPGGFDQKYLFDSRPLSLKASHEMTFYSEAEPKLWVGRNGVECLATEATKPLEVFRDDFSIINGVIMATEFDDHQQNRDMLLTSRPFGGRYFVSLFNELGEKSLIDVMRMSSDWGFNTQSIMPFSCSILSDLQKIAIDKGLSKQTENFVKSRIKNAMSGSGKMAAAADLLMKAYLQNSSIKEAINGMAIPEIVGPKESPMEKTYLALEAFRLGLTKSVFIPICPQDEHGREFNIDTHDRVSATSSVAIAFSLAETIAKIVQILKETPYSQTKSFYDCTTFIFSSEFGRTLTQSHVLNPEERGTDHNPLSNTILLGGKGIKGGLVVGESDYRKPGEVLSNVHLNLDSKSEKTMGKAFDFEKQVVRADLPQNFKVSEFISITTVLNTLLANFSIPKQHYFINDHNDGLKAPLLRCLLSQ